MYLYIMLSYDTCRYYHRYYSMKKHLYRERYLEKKTREAINEERYKQFGGEKKYIELYWKNRFWEKTNEEKKIICNSIDE